MSSLNMNNSDDTSLTSCKDSKENIHENNDFEDYLEPTEHQLKIEKSRTIDILNDTIANLCIAFTLETLFKEKDYWLSPFLTNDELEIVLNAREKNERSDSSLTFQYDKYDEINLCHALQILCKNSSIREISRSILCLDTDLVQNEIFNAITQLKKHFIERLNVSAEEERHKDNYLVLVWDKNEKAKDKINDLTIELEKQREVYSNKISKKENYIRLHQQRMEMLNLKCVEDMQSNTLLSERHMANDWHASVDKQKQLKEYYKHVNNEYESLLSKNLLKEKQSRGKRLKVETQLLNWIQKYDAEMGERQDRYDVLLQKFEDETYILKELQKKFEEQEEVYKVLMTEKEEYLYKIWCGEVHKFITNTAAKHIQKWFRRIQKETAARRKAAMKAAKKAKKAMRK